MLSLKVTSQFKKDLKKSKKQGQDIDGLQAVIETLQTGQKLDEKYRDHNLSGNWRDHRECHLAPDWLLIYMVANEELRLARVGSHSELFG